MEYKVEDICKLVKVSVRTLHYYDEIGLLKPYRRKESGSRIYSEAEVIKLVDIIFFKRLGFNLKKIGSMLNLGNKDKNVSARLVIPKGITAEKSVQSATLEAGSEKEIEFNLKNFAALPGSSYQVFAILEYDESNKHYSTVVPGIIKIAKEESFYQKYKILLIVISVILIISFLIYQFKPKAKS